MVVPGPLDATRLPTDVRSRVIPGINGLAMHILEAGFEDVSRPCVLLLHGFPELAFSWRKVMIPLAKAGYHVVAPDQRGFGRTTGWDAAYDGDLAPFRVRNLVLDVLALTFALGHREVAGIAGHDSGARVAAYCALIRPDVFRSVALMSAPFAGPPALTFGTAGNRRAKTAHREQRDIHEELAALPRPRKHYQRYYTTRGANDDMWNCRQGVGAFLRAYFHYKSADWPGNKPFPLQSWTAAELTKMPTYYIMDRDVDMAETVAPYMPSNQQVEACRWLTATEMEVYADEYSRTGFQGGLQWYRCNNGTEQAQEMRLYSGRSIDVPACFIAGESDWGVFQRPGDLEAMETRVCQQMRGRHLIAGAGHWVQQERPAEVVARLLELFGP